MGRIGPALLITAAVLLAVSGGLKLRDPSVAARALVELGVPAARPLVLTGAALELVASAPRDRVVVAESGVTARAHGAAAELAGADAILVGSALMRAPDPSARLRELLARPLVKICGLTREQDVAVAAQAGADLAGFILARETPRRAPAVTR